MLGVAGEAKAGVDRRRRDLNPDTQASQAAPPLDAGSQTRSVRQPDSLLRPTQNKRPWVQDKPFAG
jgi:hypothetical protein